MYRKEYPNKLFLNDKFLYQDGFLIKRKYKSGSLGKGIAGHKTKYGYIRTEIMGKEYSVHRLIWIWHNGCIPDGLDIDHINMIRDDNRIENLRLVTFQQNQWNTNSKGYSYNKLSKRWVAEIMVNRESTYLGSYRTEEEARTAYLEAKTKYHKVG